MRTKYFLCSCTAESIELVGWAMSTFSPVGSWSSNGMRMSVGVCACAFVRAFVRVCVHACVCVCVCVCGRNELEVCSTLTYPHNYQLIPY